MMRRYGHNSGQFQVNQTGPPFAQTDVRNLAPSAQEKQRHGQQPLAQRLVTNGQTGVEQQDRSIEVVEKMIDELISRKNYSALQQQTPSSAAASSVDRHRIFEFVRSIPEAMIRSVVVTFLHPQSRTGNIVAFPFDFAEDERQRFRVETSLNYQLIAASKRWCDQRAIEASSKIKLTKTDVSARYRAPNSKPTTKLPHCTLTRIVFLNRIFKFVETSLVSFLSGPKVIRRFFQLTTVRSSWRETLFGYPRPTRLHLGGCKNVTDRVLELLLVNLQYLQELWVHHTGIGDAGLKHVANLHLLRVLDLGDCLDITDNGMQHIAKLFNLQLLNLFGTRITDFGLQQLVNLPSLEHVETRMTRVTLDGLASFQQLRETQAAAKKKKAEEEVALKKECCEFDD